MDSKLIMYYALGWSFFLTKFSSCFDVIIICFISWAIELIKHKNNFGPILFFMA